MAQRMFHPDNDAILQTSTLLDGSPTVESLPLSFLQDQLRQKAARWARYTVDENNDKLDFNRGGVKVATLTHGSYDTPAAYATMVTAALEAADATPVWLVSYLGTGKFKVEDTNLGNFSLLWNSGANKHRSCGIDLGFEVGADDSGTFTYTADNVSYQSRKYVIVSKEDGSNITATAAIICEHTATQTGAASVKSVVTIEGNATNAWSAPAFSETFTALDTVNALTDPNVPCVQYFASSQARAYFRLTIDDVQHDISYAELGRFGLGTYSAVSICVADDLSFSPEDFTTGQEGPDGSAFASTRRHREVIGFRWAQANASDHAILLQYFRTIPTWRQWFFDFEVGAATELFYGYFSTRPTRAFQPIDYYDWQMQFIEAL